MTRREVRIDRLVLRVPRARAPSGAADAAALTRGVATGAARSAGAARGAATRLGAVSVRVVQSPGSTRADSTEALARALGRALE